MPRSILNHALVKDHELGLNHSANTSIAIGPDAAPLHVDKSVGHNTYIGHGVAELVVTSTAATHNTAIGSGAMAANTGVRNAVLGYNALSAVSTAAANISMGYISMKYTTSGFENLAVGYAAGKSIGTGERNIALGYEAIGQENSAQCTGDINICVGYESGSSLTSG